MIAIQINRELLKKQAKLLQDFIRQKYSIKINLSFCYQVLSNLYGYKDWNVLSAKIKENDLVSKLERIGIKP